MTQKLMIFHDLPFILDNRYYAWGGLHLPCRWLPSQRTTAEIQTTGGRTLVYDFLCNIFSQTFVLHFFSIQDRLAVIFALRCSPALPASWHNTNAIPVKEHSFLVHSPVNSRKQLDDNGPELAEFLVGKKLLHLGDVEEVNAMGLI